MRKLITAALVAAALLPAAGGKAEASIGDCTATRNGLTESATCYSLTAGGPQYVKAYITCAKGVTPTYTTYYGPKVGVLQTSTVTAPAGSWGCFGGYTRVS